MQFAIMIAPFQYPNGRVYFRNIAASTIIIIRFRKLVIIAELVSNPIASTLSRSRDRESMPNGKLNKKPLKRKRARSRDLALKRRQFVSLIVKYKSEPISIYEIVRICYVW